MQQSQREGSQRGIPPSDWRSSPKPNTDGYWSGPLQLLTLRVRVRGCNAEESSNTNKSSKAKWNPRRILPNKVLHDSTLLHLSGKDWWVSAFFGPWPPPYFHSFIRLLCLGPGFLQNETGAIRKKQCYGVPCGYFIGPQWYFIDAWNNASAQPKQAIWKPWRN